MWLRNLISLSELVSLMNSDLYDSEHLSLLSEVPYYLELICLSLIDIVATLLCLLDIKFVVLKLV